MARILLSGLVLSFWLAAASAQDTTGQGEAVAQAAQTEAAEEIGGGELRIEPWYVLESRVQFHGDPLPNSPTSRLEFNVKLLGDQLGDIRRMGRLVIDEAVDDQGRLLWDAGRITDQMRTATHLFEYQERAIRNGYIDQVVRLDLPQRDARKIALVRGYVNLVFSDGEAEAVIVEKPLQYMGGVIKHPRLRELGIELGLLSPAQLGRSLDEHTFALAEGDSAARVRSVVTYDDWFRSVRTDSTNSQDRDGNPCQLYRMSMGRFNNDCELAIYVYRQIHEERVEFTFHDLELD